MTTPTAVSIEEMEKTASDASPKPPTPAEIKLEGDDLPEDVRGKTVKDLLSHADALKKALQLSEESRLTLSQALKGRESAPAQPTPPAPPPEPELTDEQLAELYQENPIKAIKLMNEQAVKRAAASFDARVAPLVQGSSTMVETQARERFKTEFELFGDQIQNIINGLPDKSVLTSPKAWDDMVSYVRGQPQNFQRLVQYHTQGASKNQQDAQQQQLNALGFSSKPQEQPRVAENVGGLDATQREIAEQLGMTPEEYVRWSKV